MSFPIRTTVEDIKEVCAYLATKPTGASVGEAKAVLDPKRLDGRKINALKLWGLIEEQDNKLKVTSLGRECVKSEDGQYETLSQVIKKIAPYLAIIERAAHRHEDTLSVTDVAAHWHDHFKEHVGDSDKIIKDQAVCFFQVAMGVGLGTLIIGRHGQQTRFSFAAEALSSFIEGVPLSTDTPPAIPEIPEIPPETPKETPQDQPPATEEKRHEKDKLGQGIFIAHGKNKKPLDQLKKILDQFRIPYKVAIDEPNLGRPISGKLREIMKSCNCAILIFTADEEFKDKDGNDIWRPSENVVYELGATGYLYDNRIVIMKEEAVSFPSNFSDIGYISFEKDQLAAKAMDILKELIGFGIVKVST